MGLEIRRGRGGELRKHWYGSYVDGNGKRRVIALTEPLPVKHFPGSLKATGDTVFEASRVRAEQELAGFQTEARQQGRADHLTAQLIESKTGRKWKETPLAALPDIITGGKKRRARSQQHETWKRGAVEKFTAWASGRGLVTVLEVTPEVAQAYVASLYEPDTEGRTRTAASIRKHKAVIGRALRQALPNGVENPFTGVDVETTDGDRVYNREPLNPGEIETLLAAAAGDRTAFDLIVAGLSTGLRRGDVCRLRWASVDLRGGALKLTTSKTKAELYLPVMPRFREVLEARLAERVEGAAFVFPEAERELRTNPGGVSRRIKKAFALAFAKPQDAPQAAQDAPERVPLANILPQVLQAVQSAKMTETKRAKMLDLLQRHAAGQSYRDMQKDWRISRGSISGLLHEAEQVAGVRFLPETNGTGINAAIREVTRTRRAVGLKSASRYDFHALRTSFVTMALNAGMKIEMLKALTGHSLVETVLRFYYKPKGTDARAELEAALPDVLTGRNGAAKQIGAGGTVEGLAAQLQTLSPADRARLAKLLKGGGK